MRVQASWEKYATILANISADEAFADGYCRLADDLKIKPDAKARVIFARDTRASGPRLVSALLEGLKCVQTEYTDFKILTTPQLHYLTRSLNTVGTQFEYGDPTERGYYEKIAASLEAAMRGRKFSGSVTVDCANGVGGPKLKELIKHLPQPSDGGLEIKVVNDDIFKPERLNYQV
jgi:phosphoacetylglucosamine mutase